MSAVALAGLTFGSVGLVYLSTVMDGRSARTHGAGDIGAVPADDNPMRLALIIAVGVGLHSFAEGLAIGQAAADGIASLALVLVIGFALHNAT